MKSTRRQSSCLASWAETRASVCVPYFSIGMSSHWMSVRSRMTTKCLCAGGVSLTILRNFPSRSGTRSKKRRHSKRPMLKKPSPPIPARRAASPNACAPAARRRRRCNRRDGWTTCIADHLCSKGLFPKERKYRAWDTYWCFTA